MFVKRQIYSVFNDDHDCLYRGLRSLRKMIEEKDDNESISNVLKLITFECYGHFYREEEMMEVYQYPSLNDHHYDHSLMMQFLQTLVGNVSYCRYDLKVSDIDQVLDMLTRHISSDDAQLETFMAKVEPPKSGEDLFEKISFLHRIKLGFKLWSSRIKVVSTTLVFSRRPVQYKRVSKPVASLRQRQHEQIKNYSGWYYGNY